MVAHKLSRTNKSPTTQSQIFVFLAEADMEEDLLDRFSNWITTDEEIELYESEKKKATKQNQKIRNKIKVACKNFERTRSATLMHENLNSDMFKEELGKTPRGASSHK